MNALFPFLLITVFGSLAISFGLFRARKINKIMDKTAKTLGLSFEKGNLLNPPAMHGRYESFRINIEHVYASRNTAAHDCISLKFIKPVSFPFSIRPEKIMSKINHALGINDLQTGDQVFDDSVLLQSPHEDALLGLLCEPARSRILHQVESSYRKQFLINQKGIEVAKEEGLKMENIIENLVQLAKIITRDGTPQAQLLDNFFNDTRDFVRTNNLRMLFTFYPAQIDNQEIIKATLVDQNPEINFIAFSYNAEQQSPYYLKKIWMKSSSLLREKILKFLAEKKEPLFLDFLIREYKKVNPELQLLILEVCEKTASETVNSFLIHQLDSSSGRLLSAIVKALGPCGKVDAVEPLMNIKNPLISGAAKKAIIQIQSRLKEGEHGWLSLAGQQPDAGSLAISRQLKQGELSLKDEK